MNMNTSMPINLQQSWQSRRRSVVAGTRCGVGLNNPTSIAGAKRDKPQMSAPNSRRWNTRSESCAKLMKSSEKRQHILRPLSHMQACVAAQWDGARPPLQTMIAFIEEHRDDLGVTSRDHAAHDPVGQRSRFARFCQLPSQHFMRRPPLPETLIWRRIVSSEMLF